MKTLMLAFLAACTFIVAPAQDSLKVKELEQRIKILEEKVARLEVSVKNGSLSDEAKKCRQAARQRSESDERNFRSEDIKKAEDWYVRASQNARTAESAKLLDSLVSQYPKLNRAGCAQLYLAQWEKSGPEKERLLKDCIDRFYNCYYFDGTQVGPFAIYQLAFYYKEQDKKEEARKLFKRIRSDSPDAVNHNGELLINNID